MTDRQNVHTLESGLAETAAEWVLTLEEGALSSQQQQAFRQWLANSPEHWQAYHDARSMIKEIDLLGEHHYSKSTVQSESPVDRQLTRSAVNHDVVKPLHRRTFQLSFALAASLVIAVVGYWQWNMGTQQETIYTTTTGELRQLELSDNSTVHLNTRSKIAVEMQSNARRITLLEGEALFDVAQDSTRPFSVFVRDIEVSVVGTEFNVYKQHNKTLISVLEGRVKVSFVDNASNSGQNSQTIYIDPGSQVVVESGSRNFRLEKTGSATTTAWRTGKLVFNEKPLSEVIEEFNRYNEGRLVVSGNDLKSLEITGTFDPFDVGAFIRSLHQIAHVRTNKVSNYVTLLSRDLARD